MRFKNVLFKEHNNTMTRRNVVLIKVSKLDLSVNGLGDFLSFYTEKTTFIVTLQHIIQQNKSFNLQNQCERTR